LLHSAVGSQFVEGSVGSDTEKSAKVSSDGNQRPSLILNKTLRRLPWRRSCVKTPAKKVPIGVVLVKVHPNGLKYLSNIPRHS
jgi:hypothetical protein